MIRISRLLTCAALALLLLAPVSPRAVAQSHAGHESHDPDVSIDEPDVVMHVTGLACEMCARSVTNELKKVDAIQEIEVLLEDDQRILLTFKEGEKVEEKTLREAVTNAGFSTRDVVYRGADDSSS